MHAQSGSGCDMAELTQNEKRLLAVLEKEERAEAPSLAGLLGTTPEAVVQWAHLAQEKGLVITDRIVDRELIYTDEGKRYLEIGLPETQLLQEIRGRATVADLRKHAAFTIGFGQLRKKGLIRVTAAAVERIQGASTDADESALRNPAPDDPRVKDLIKRGILTETETVRHIVTITPEGRALVQAGLDLRAETGTLTRHQILSGGWRDGNFRRYDVKKLPRRMYPGKIHPYQRIIGEMREILLNMGFEELYGGIVQQC